MLSVRQRYRQTDRQTDRQADVHRAVMIATSAWLSHSFRVHQIRYRPGLTDPLAGLRGTMKGYNKTLTLF